MGPYFTKTLRFTYENLDKEGYLIFTFDNEKVSGQERYKGYFPVVWRAVHLWKTGRHDFYVTFKQKFLFATCQVQKGMVTTDSAINDEFSSKQLGERTDLTDDEGFKWSDPTKTAADTNALEARNQTAEAQDISFCCEGDSPWPEALLCFKSVGSQTTLQVEFTGQLRIYNDPSLQGEISAECDTICPKHAGLVKPPTSQPIWDHALCNSGVVEDWIITYNARSANFEIKEAKEEGK